MHKQLRKFIHRCKPVESSLAFIAGFWGLLLLTPLDTFGAGSDYTKFLKTLPENTWGWIMLILSVATVAGMLGRYYHIRRAALLASTFIWFFISSLLFAGNQASTGWVAYLNYALLSSWAYVKVGEQRHGR